MAKSLARGFISSKGKETTTEAMQNIIPEAPEGWTYQYIIKKISFRNEAKCTLIINEAFEIMLEAGRGFESGYEDVAIKDLRIKESGISYEFVASY